MDADRIQLTGTTLKPRAAFEVPNCSRTEIQAAGFQSLVWRTCDLNCDNKGSGNQGDLFSLGRICTVMKWP